MNSVRRMDDIESGSGLGFENRWRRVERISWTIMTLLVLCGLAGLFGSGPLSKATAQSPGGESQVRYERLARRQTPTRLDLHLGREAIATGQVRVCLNRAIFDSMQVQNILPRPVATEPLADGVRLTFATDPAAGSANIVFVQEPATAGFLDGEIAVEGVDPLRIRLFVYP